MRYTPLAQRRTTASNRDVVQDIMDRLSAVESGGNYQALGPEVTSGMYAGERALGKYQVMPGNLATWSMEALGREVTPDEFLADPDIQEAIVRHQTERNYERYGNPEDVASVWFTGRPVAEAGDAADVTGTTNTEYQRKFAQAGATPLGTGSMRYRPLSRGM